MHCRRIYTKTGDRGTASLYSGARRGKDDAVFHALGDVDELNSAVGVAREFVAELDPTIAQQVGGIVNTGHQMRSSRWAAGRLAAKMELI